MSEPSLADVVHEEVRKAKADERHDPIYLSSHRGVARWVECGCGWMWKVKDATATDCQLAFGRHLLSEAARTQQ